MRERDLFIEALQCPDPAERARYLDATCGGDEALRDRVLQLLAAHQKQESFLLDALPPLIESTQTLGNLRPVLLREAEGESTLVAKPTSDALPPLEQTDDRYQLQGEIARGGMGVVLRGRDVHLGRDLAVKVLLEKYVDQPDIARRFLEEAQIGGQLQHPGVVPVYDLGRFGDRPFFTMKLVKGQTLATLLCERTDPAQELPRLLDIAVKVAQTVAYAHAKGVIHRDLKPANIMVGAFGEVQVMDWGLAKVLAEGDTADEARASRGHQAPEDVTTIRTARSTGSAGTFGGQTEAGALLGTLAYMPPEQANGDVALLDRRADVFGLGAILCEILTGKPPYEGRSSEEVRRKAANGDLAEALARLDSCGADQELIGLTKACLAPEAIDRPKDAKAVAEGLTAYLDGVQQRLHQAELAEAQAIAKAVEEAKHRRLTLALAATVLLALTLGGGGWLYVKADREARQAALTREVNDAFNKATALRAQTSSARTGGALRFAQAREQAQRALALVESGPADATLRTQVTRLQTELDEEAEDRKLVAALDEARLAQAETLSENRFALGRAVPLFRKAFRAYGLPPGESAPAAAERIRQRPPAIQEAIVAALDEWDDLAGNPKLGITEPHREWLRAVVAAAAPADSWTQEFRAALAEPDAAKRRQALLKLAAAVDVRQQSPRTLTRLARRLEDVEPAGAGPLNATRPAALQLLRRAQQQYPADFWINHNLGVGLGRENATPSEKDESVRFLTAAVALRPESPGAHCNLGIALSYKGQLDEAIACYQKALALDPQYALAHNNLGSALKGKGQLDEAIACYREAIALDPKLALAHNNLGSALHGKGQVEEAIACYRKALALDPMFALAHNYLGTALVDKGQLDGAIASFQKALALDPKDALAHYNLAIALSGKGQVDEAIDCYQKALALDPKDANAHYGLGVALFGKGQMDEAIACYRKTIAIDPKYLKAHYNLGYALSGKGQVDEAIACFQKLVALDPKLVMAHYSLGHALSAKGQLDAAIASYRQAIALDPNHAEAHCNLGSALRSQGRFAEALAAYQRGHELSRQRPRWPYPSAAWVREAERLAALEAKLPAFRKGQFTPRDAAERLGLADVCQAKKLPPAAARLYAAAFTADPRLADDLGAGHRYNAACSAALAAAGQGEDATPLDDQERAHLRRQALDWLRADLVLHTKQLERGQPADRAAVQQNLKHWQEDSDLAGLRDKVALSNLSADEQKEFAQLWADVAALLKKGQTPAPKEGGR
jgi:serine/threonine-protein kinase